MDEIIFIFIFIHIVKNKWDEGKSNPLLFRMNCTKSGPNVIIAAKHSLKIKKIKS